MTTREISTDDGTVWTLAQAASDGDAPEGHVTVVATPSGGEQTLRLALGADWHGAASDDDLAAALAAARAADGRDDEGAPAGA